MLVLLMSRSKAMSSIYAVLLMAGVALVVVVTQSIPSTFLNRIGGQPVSRQLRAIVASHAVTSSSYSAFTFQRDLYATAQSPLQSTPITLEHLPYNGNVMPFKLPQNAADWCMPPSLTALNYQNCDPSKPVNRLPLIGGMTNALKMVLLGTIVSFEEGRCFYIDESSSHLRMEREGQTHSLFRRYFAPIGLDIDSIIVQKAMAEGRVETKDWHQIWEVYEKRRALKSEHFIPYLANERVNGHRLKFITLLRMWRPLDMVRNSACGALEQHHGLTNDYMALSVRRGDKHTVEHFDYPTADAYIIAAKRAIQSRFGGVVPHIFVATDDCSVMSEFRALQPTWNFVGQCDLAQNSADNGFALTDIKDWSEQDTDQHYEKFMTELFGLAIAKHVVGVTYTNVSWWVLFMRRANLDGMEFIDDDRGDAAMSW